MYSVQGQALESLSSDGRARSTTHIVPVQLNSTTQKRTTQYSTTQLMRNLDIVKHRLMWTCSMAQVNIKMKKPRVPVARSIWVYVSLKLPRPKHRFGYQDSGVSGFPLTRCQSCCNRGPRTPKNKKSHKELCHEKSMKIMKRFAFWSPWDSIEQRQESLEVVFRRLSL